MMPAASTSDHRTYSSMTNGVAGITSPTARRSGEGRAGRRATPAERAASDARGGAPASTAVGLQAVGLETPPQGGAADAEAPGGFGEPAVRAVEHLDDRLALPLGQRRGLLGARVRQHTDLGRSRAERHDPRTQRCHARPQQAGPLLSRQPRELTAELL